MANDMQYIGGGQGAVDMWPVRKNTAGDAYELRQGLAATVVAAVFATTGDFNGGLKLRSLFEDVKVSFAGDQNAANHVITNKGHGKPFLDWRNAVAIPDPAGAKNLPEFYSNNGIKFGGTSSTGKYNASIAYGSLWNDGTNDLIEMAITVGVVPHTAGERTIKHNEGANPTVQVDGVVLDLPLVIPMEIFDPDIVAVAADITIPAGQGYYEGFVPIAAEA
jgi:hypothetical protein